MMKPIKYVMKRDGSQDVFDKKMITNAILKAFDKANEGNRFLANKITESVVETLMRTYYRETPHVERIQDIVEDALIDYNFKNAAKEYIRFRAKRNMEREQELFV